MASKGQMTGMRGVYLVAAELSRLGLIASPTSRSAVGADILATDHNCSTTFSVQVKTNAKTFGFWLLGRKAKDIVSPSHIYVLVNLRSTKAGEVIEYYVVPSTIVAKKMFHSKASTGSEWYAINLKDIESYKDKWEHFAVENLAPRSTRSARKRAAG